MSLAAMSKLSGYSQTFVANVRGGTAEKNALLALAAARAIVNRLPLPSSPVADQGEYFVTQFKAQVEQLAGEINELVVIGLPQTIEFVKTLWKMRYKVVHPTGRLFPNGQDNFMSFLGLSSLVTPELARLIVLNENELLVAVNGFTDLLDDLVPMPCEAGENNKALSGPDTSLC